MLGVTTKVLSNAMLRKKLHRGHTIQWLHLAYVLQLTSVDLISSCKWFCRCFLLRLLCHWFFYDKALMFLVLWWRDWEAGSFLFDHGWHIVLELDLLSLYSGFVGGEGRLHLNLSASLRQANVCVLVVLSARGAPLLVGQGHGTNLQFHITLFLLLHPIPRSNALFLLESDIGPLLVRDFWFL